MEMVLERYELVVAVMAVGIVVRSLCPHLKDKWTDRPVVAVDSSLSCAVPVVGGHHGANELARFLASQLGLFAAITTATDASGRPCLEEVATRLARSGRQQRVLQSHQPGLSQRRRSRFKAEGAQDCGSG